MRYVNPFLLLGIQPDSLFDNAKVFRERRRSLLAELALDGAMKFDGAEIDRPDAIRILDDLDDDDKRHFHAMVLSEDNLHSFLRFGQCHRPLEFPREIYSTAFVDFLGPYFVERFAASLKSALAKRDVSLAEDLVNTKFPFSDRQRESAYRPAKNYFQALLKSIESKRDILEESEDIFDILPDDCYLVEDEPEFFNPFSGIKRVQPLRNFVESLISTADLSILNSLPEEFQHLRNEVAKTIGGLGVLVSNQLDEDEISAVIFTRALDVQCGKKDRDHISRNLEIVKPYAVRKWINSLRRQLLRIAESTRGRTFDSGDEVRQLIDRIFDSRSISRWSSSQVNTEIIGLTKQVTEIAWLLTTSYRSPQSGIKLVEKCLELRLSDASVTTALLKNLTDVRASIERSTVVINATHTPRPAGVKFQPPPKSRTSTTPPNTTSRSGVKTNQTNTTKEPIDFEFSSLSATASESQGLFSSLLGTIRQASIAELLVALLVILVVCGAGLIIIAAGFNVKPGMEQLHSPANTSNSNSYSAKSNTPAVVVPNPVVRANAVPLPASSGTTTPTPTDQYSPTPTPTPTPQVVRPSSGSVLSGNGGRGLGELEIWNGASTDAIARLRLSSSGRMYKEVYVRSGETANIRGISPGTYELVFATGYNYAPSVSKFLSSPSYQRFDDLFTYYETRDSDGINYKTYRVTLNKVVSGNASTSSIGEDDFDK